MESRVGEYREVYAQYYQKEQQIDQGEKNIRQLESEIGELGARQNAVDYNNVQIIVAAMEKYAATETEKRKKEIAQNVDKDISNIIYANGRFNPKLEKNVKNVMEWIGKNNVETLLKKLFAKSDDYELDSIKSTKILEVLNVINIVLDNVFRLKFTEKKFPKVARLFLSVLVMMGVSGFLSLQWLTFMKWFLIILVLNIGVVIAGRTLSKNYVKKHKATTYAFFFLNDFRSRLYDTRYRCFEEDEMACWKEEIENVKKGRTTVAINKPIYPIVKQNLQEKYEALGSQIKEKQNNISQLSSTIEGVNAQSLKLAEDLKARESGINALISDREHNNGVLTPYVSICFSGEDRNGVKKLNSFKHGYSPMLFVYNNELRRDGDRFRKNVSRLVELMMNGFLKENSFGIIKMYLVDFETGGALFPANRTKGILNIIRNQEELKKLYDDLKTVSDKVRNTGEGRIENINPENLRKRENIIEYHIVFFFGVDFTSLDRETAQLFLANDNFGFLPIIFMRKTEADVLSDIDCDKAFANVIGKIKSNEQVYSFERTLNCYEHGLLVTDNKNRVDICAQTVMSHKEFVEKTTTGTINVSTDVVMDAVGMSKLEYDEVFKNNLCRLFASSDNLPDFVQANELSHID